MYQCVPSRHIGYLQKIAIKKFIMLREKGLEVI